MPLSPDASAPDSAADDAAPLDAEPDSAPACGAGTQRDCYSGPASTRGVGVCRAGVQRCFEGTWGPCVGETTPGAEVCGNGADDDCNGTVDCASDAGREAGDASAPDAAGPCVDADGDGYGVGSGCRGPDCNDGDRETHPGALERCDGQDNNCDGMPETAANAPALDAWCRMNAPAFTSPANWRDITQCDGPRRIRINPPDPNDMASFACRACERSPTPPFEVICWCWRSPTDRQPCSAFR
jgi:hypothetical protein